MSETLIERKFVKRSQISKHLVCSVCYEVFNQPVHLSCLHTFCDTCIRLWQKSKKTCPECRQNIVLKNIKKDLIASKIIEDFEVFCVNDLLCTWKGPLYDLNNPQKGAKYNFSYRHLQTCSAIYESSTAQAPEWIQKLKTTKSPDQIDITQNIMNMQFEVHYFQQNLSLQDEELVDKCNENIPKQNLITRVLSKNITNFEIKKDDKDSIADIIDYMNEFDKISEKNEKKNQNATDHYIKDNKKDFAYKQGKKSDFSTFEIDEEIKNNKFEESKGFNDQINDDLQNYQFSSEVDQLPSPFKPQTRFKTNYRNKATIPKIYSDDDEQYQIIKPSKKIKK